MVEKQEKAMPKKTAAKEKTAAEKATVKKKKTAPEGEGETARKKTAKPATSTTAKKKAVHPSESGDVDKDKAAKKTAKPKAKKESATADTSAAAVTEKPVHAVDSHIHKPAAHAHATAAHAHKPKESEAPVDKKEIKVEHKPAVHTPGAHHGATPKVEHDAHKKTGHPAHPAPAAPVHKPSVHPASAQPVKHAPAAPVAHPVTPKHVTAAVAPVVAPVQKPAAPAAQPVAPTAAAPAAPATTAVAEPVKSKGEIVLNELITVRDLADKMNLKAGDLIKKLIGMGSLATINQRLDTDTATLLVHEFGYEVKVESLYVEEPVEEEVEDPATLKPRSPVVTIMGHVDHGKTSLLDAIRETRVAEGEAGGITQHIGAYKVKTDKGEVSFLDTPGHEAFTAMRSRGAQATDIVVLVVSAADGVMPQTVEAIDHARAAGVPIIVAINKIDLPTARPDQVKQELSKYNLVCEEWGGDTIMVAVSARQHTNIDGLLEMILLKAEMMELKANPDRLARGLVIEAKLDSRRGPVATVLVQAGTMKVGDNIVVGTTFGKVRAMLDEHGTRLITAGPSTPVEILGLNTPPQAGDLFIAVAQEFQAREIADKRKMRAREDSLRPRHHLTLEDISAGKAKELRIILKTDVQGSLEALADSLERLSTSEISLRIIHRGAGSITESDVTLAAASDAFIIGFNLRPDSSVEKIADREGVNIRVYRIIYEVIADVKSAMEGMLEPQIKETVVGKAQVKQVFKVSKVGMISGCTVLDGKISRGNKVRLLRDNVIVFEGNLTSLRRFKDDVRDVEKGFECGIGLENYANMKPGDIIEAFTEEKVARKL